MTDPILSKAAACNICDAEGRIRTTAGGYQECLHQPEDAARVPVSFGRATVERTRHDSYRVTLFDLQFDGLVRVVSATERCTTLTDLEGAKYYFELEGEPWPL